jgi:hypothetical protein
MLWQQKLGKYSNAVKQFANRWYFLSWVNFTLVVIINIMFILFLEYKKDLNKLQLTYPYQVMLQNTISMIQTIVAAIVVMSYYMEYRASLKYLIQKNKISKMMDVAGYGGNQGSVGYGNRKAGHMQVKKGGSSSFSIKKLSKQGGAVGKMIYIIGKECWHFVKACTHDRDHARNIIYLWISVYASSEGG